MERPPDFEEQVRAHEESMRRYAERHAEENDDYLFLGNHELTIFGEQAWMSLNMLYDQYGRAVRAGPAVYSNGKIRPSDGKVFGIYIYREHPKADQATDMTLTEALDLEREEISDRKASLPELAFYEDDPNFPEFSDLPLKLGRRMPRLVNNLSLSFSSIWNEAGHARDAIMEARTSMDDYRDATAREDHAREGMEDMSASFIGVLFALSRRDNLAACVRKTREALGSVYTLWEYSAHLLRNGYKIRIPFREVALTSVLKTMHADRRFERLIKHVQFIRTGGSARFEEGSVLSRLRNYRNLAAHLMDFSSDAVDRGMDRGVSGDAPDLYSGLHDFMENRDIPFMVEQPDEILGLAEEAYHHYASGYDIICDMMAAKIRELSRMAHGP